MQICKCGAVENTETEKIFSNGTKHIELRCKGCHTHRGYKPQGKFEDFSLWFGKHKGKTLMQIYKEEPSYLDWIYANVAKDSMKKKIEEVLKIGIAIEKK